MGCQPSSTPANDTIGGPRISRHPRRIAGGTTPTVTDDARSLMTPTNVRNPMAAPSSHPETGLRPNSRSTLLNPAPPDVHTNTTSHSGSSIRGSNRSNGIEGEGNENEAGAGGGGGGIPFPFGVVPATDESDFFHSVRESTPTRAMSSGIPADDDADEDNSTAQQRGRRKWRNDKKRSDGARSEVSGSHEESESSASRASSSQGSEVSARSYGMASTTSSIIDDCDPFDGVTFASKPTDMPSPSPLADAEYPTSIHRHRSATKKGGKGAERHTMTSPSAKRTPDLTREVEGNGSSVGSGGERRGGGGGSGRKMPSPSISIFEFRSFRASLLLSQRQLSISGAGGGLFPTSSSSDRSRVRCRTLDTPLGSAKGGATQQAGGDSSGGPRPEEVEDAFFGEADNDQLLGPLLDSLLASVCVEDLLKAGAIQREASILAGSTSTARLSVNSASTTTNSSSDDEEQPHHRQRVVRAMDLPSTGTPSPGSISSAGARTLVEDRLSAVNAFNSLSALAPHVTKDKFEIKKRLKGGYTDTMSPLGGGGIYYPTPQERRVAREQELQNEARSRQVLCPGKGLLWSHPSVQEGLPCPLDVLERSYEREPLFTHNPPWYTDVRCRGRILQFLFAIQQFLPSLMAELTDADRLAPQSVAVAVTMIEEFVAATHRDTCRHPRIRILLTQLLVLLRDTIVLLEEPERFLQEFSKVNEAELIDLLGDVSLSQQTTEQATDEDLTLLFQALKRHQAKLFLYVLLMIENCVWMAAVETRQHRDLSPQRM